MLASGSPQRRAILERLGVPFEVRAPGVEEVDEGGEAAALTLANAARKAHAARRAGTRELVLACDTLVQLEGRVYGKPPNRGAAERMLRALGGRTHEVISGLVLLTGREERSVQARTEVSFRVLDERLLGWYIAREEWRGRAGAYAIQGAGAALVREVRGDYENVVGLPLASLLDVCPELLTG